MALASTVAADPCTSNADCSPGQLCLINGQCVGHETLEMLKKASAVQQRDASSQSACTTDSDCPDTHFCKEVAFMNGLWCQDDMECWPKNSLGGRCGGYTGHCAEDRCLSDFVCIDQVCSTGQECMLECGTSVPHNWTGRDQGFLRCREVRCNNGVLDLVRTVPSCTPRDCPGKPGREDLIP